jgi:uncharacterized protein
MSDAELRTSSYVIYVDLPEDPGKMLLVHGYSGAYDVVSRKVASYLRSKEQGRPPKPLFGAWVTEPELSVTDYQPSTDTLRSLQRRGYLTEMTVAEEEAYIAKLAGILHEAAQHRLSWIFMPNYDCNLRCFYCFQDHMRTDAAYQHLLRRMTPELVDRLFGAVHDIEARHGVTAPPRRNIGFFGGEPLLADNREIVEYIMRLARKDADASFWAVSNGTDLSYYEDILGADGISAIQITLDGPSYEHDKRRIYADGSGSFARIADNITLALDRGVSVHVRMNIDRENIQLLPTLADEMIARGWHTYKAFVAYTYPIHAANEKTDKKTTFNPWELDVAIGELRLEFPQLKIIDRPDDRMRESALRLFGGVSAEPALKAEFCGAHAGMYIFDALGDIYACWERTGDKQLRIGHVRNDGTVELNAPVTTAWRSRSVAVVPACRKCRYALQCGGGCAVLAEGKRGTLHANHCDAYANRFRAMVAEAYLAHAAGETAGDSRDRVCDL